MNVSYKYIPKCVVHEQYHCNTIQTLDCIESKEIFPNYFIWMVNCISENTDGFVAAEWTIDRRYIAQLGRAEEKKAVISNQNS